MFNTAERFKLDIDKSVVRFPGSYIVGNVKIGENSSVWYNAVVRGDVGPIFIGNNSNIQDNCVIHSSPDLTVVLKNYVSVGHGSVLHGCEVGENVLVGMNSTILNGVKIGNDSIVGAGALITEGKEFPDQSLILGVPGKVVRELTFEEIRKIKENALKYVKLADFYSNK